MFTPRLAAASLSGRSDATWALAVSEYIGAAFMGGIALDGPTRNAARQMVERDRNEFLPPDPIGFIDEQLSRLDDHDILAGFNVRAVDPVAIHRAAEICVSHGALIEINAHCRQEEMCAVGAGESLLHDSDRLCEQVQRASLSGACVSVKVRAEVPGIDLVTLSTAIVEAGGTIIHVDAMDSPDIVGDIAQSVDAFVIGNNGVRDVASARQYLDRGADAVSVGRASDDPETLATIQRAAMQEVSR